MLKTINFVYILLIYFLSAPLSFIKSNILVLGFSKFKTFYLDLQLILKKKTDCFFRHGKTCFFTLFIVALKIYFFVTSLRIFFKRADFKAKLIN